MGKILVTQSSMPPMEEFIEEIKVLWDTRWLTNMGAKHMQFQRDLVKYMCVENVELLTNGHMALELTLQAMNLKGEVITTPFTFASTVHAIVRNGLKPVFCDIDPISYTIDVNKIESLINENTCAILPVHVYGNICDVDSIEHIANTYGLKVLYDAAHCFGETYKGVGVGNFGDASAFSFHATKVFNSIEGGCVAFKDEKLGAKLYDLKNFGIHGTERVTAVGANAKMNEFCAAMGICNLRHLEEEIQKRKVVATRYRERLKDVKGITLNVIQEDVKSNYAYFPITIDSELCGYTRDDIFNKLEENGIGTRKYFYPLINEYECYSNDYNVMDTPIAKKIADSIITLPMYADLQISEVDRICDIIKSVN